MNVRSPLNFFGLFIEYRSMTVSHLANVRSDVDELGVWRQPWNKINSDYRDEYHKHFPPSDPVEDCDDRNALYAM